MLKTVLRLVEYAVNGQGACLTLGNHRFVRTETQWLFYYHNTPVCIVDRQQRTIKLTDGGWKTSSTTRTLKSYREAFPDYVYVQ